MWWSVTRGPVVHWFTSTVSALGCVGSLTAMWHAYERYLHHLHAFEQERIHARFVLTSNACADQHRAGDSMHSGSRTKRYVDCDGALEALNGAAPSSRAMGSVLDEWSVCGEGRCAQLVTVALEMLQTMRSAAPVIAVLLLWMLAHWIWFGFRQRRLRLGGMAPLYAGDGYHGEHRCLWAPDNEWDLSGGGDHMLAMAGARSARSLRRRRALGDASARRQDEREDPDML